MLQEIVSLMNPLVTIVTKITEYDKFTILPYCELHKKGSIESLNFDKPVFTHVRGEIQPHVKPEVDLERFNKFPIVYAGDLHSFSNSQKNIVYPGSPLTTNFHRNLVETGYILIDKNDLTNYEWYSWNIPQLIRKTVSSEEEMVKTDYHHTVYELEGNLNNLANIKDSELLDKKIVHKNTDSSLIFTDEMTLNDELYDYFTCILGLPDEETKEILKTFNDHINEVKSDTA